MRHLECFWQSSHLSKIPNAPRFCTNYIVALQFWHKCPFFHKDVLVSLKGCDLFVCFYKWHLSTVELYILTCNLKSQNFLGSQRKITSLPFLKSLTISVHMLSLIFHQTFRVCTLLNPSNDFSRPFSFFHDVQFNWSATTCM